MPDNAKYWDFTLQEYRERVASAQRLMRAQGMDCLLLSQFENIYYFSGYLTWLIRTSKHRPTVLLIPESGEPVLILPDLEVPAAQMVSWVKDMRGWTANYISMWVEAFKEFGVAKGTIGAELGEESNLGMPINDWNGLHAQLPGARWTDVQDLLYSLRSIKSPQERDYMRKAGQLAGDACAAAWDLLRTARRTGKTVTEWDIFRAMTAQAMQSGALLPGFVNVRSGRAQGMMHNKYPTQREIQEGDWVAMDYGFIYKNYNSDVIRVGCFGKPPADWERYHQIQVDMAARIRQTARPGVTVKELCQIKADECQKHGLELPWKGIGHCIGLNIHELPRINPDVDLTLKPGMCFTVEPGFAVEGNTFCVEDVVLVTENGHETLTEFSRELFVA